MAWWLLYLLIYLNRTEPSWNLEAQPGIRPVVNHPTFSNGCKAPAQLFLEGSQPLVCGVREERMQGLGISLHIPTSGLIWDWWHSFGIGLLGPPPQKKKII